MITPAILIMKVCRKVICMLIRMIDVVSVSIMVVAEVMKREFVPKLLTEVDSNTLFNDWIVWRKLAEFCLLYRLALVDEFRREDIFVLTLSSIVFAYFSDVSVFAS